VHFGALSMLKFVFFEMYNYLINLRPVLLVRAPLQLRALSARLFRLWVNLAVYWSDAPYYYNSVKIALVRRYENNDIRCTLWHVVCTRLKFQRLQGGGITLAGYVIAY